MGHLLNSSTNIFPTSIYYKEGVQGVRAQNLTVEKRVKGLGQILSGLKSYLHYLGALLALVAGLFVLVGVVFTPESAEAAQKIRVCPENTTEENDDKCLQHSYTITVPERCNTGYIENQITGQCEKEVTAEPSFSCERFKDVVEGELVLVADGPGGASCRVTQIYAPKYYCASGEADGIPLGSLCRLQVFTEHEPICEGGGLPISPDGLCFRCPSIYSCRTWRVATCNPFHSLIQKDDGSFTCRNSFPVYHHVLSTADCGTGEKVTHYRCRFVYSLPTAPECDEGDYDPSTQRCHYTDTHNPIEPDKCDEGYEQENKYTNEILVEITCQLYVDRISVCPEGYIEVLANPEDPCQLPAPPAPPPTSTTIKPTTIATTPTTTTTLPTTTTQPVPPENSPKCVYRADGTEVCDLFACPKYTEELSFIQNGRTGGIYICAISCSDEARANPFLPGLSELSFGTFVLISVLIVHRDGTPCPPVSPPPTTPLT